MEYRSGTGKPAKKKIHKMSVKEMQMKEEKKMV